ncbi:hypothetical protein [Thermococcus sp. JCM 11816]|uniref:hypothetical protein n=1 Tax=Thermococcus sp. (strain JCM 11816 / KS-1) TaxID=1295125 RepID=UPI000A775ADE
MKAVKVLAVLALLLGNLGFVSAWPTNGPTLDDPMNVHQKLTYKAIEAVYADNPGSALSSCSTRISSSTAPTTRTGAVGT